MVFPRCFLVPTCSQFNHKSSNQTWRAGKPSIWFDYFREPNLHLERIFPHLPICFPWFSPVQTCTKEITLGQGSADAILILRRSLAHAPAVAVAEDYLLTGLFRRLGNSVGWNIICLSGTHNIRATHHIYIAFNIGLICPKRKCLVL
jgi:hypothetical protein